MYALELRQKAATVFAGIKEITERAAAEKRLLTAEELDSIQKRQAEYDGLVAQVDVFERTAQIDRFLNDSQRQIGAVGGQAKQRLGQRNSDEYRRALLLAANIGRERLAQSDRSALEAGFEDQMAYRRAYWGYMRSGFDELADDARHELRVGFTQTTPEMRALSVGIPTAGGYLVPDEDQLMIIDAMKSYGGMLGVSQVLTTNTGAEIPIPTSDDTANAGEQVGENSVVSEQDITIAQKGLPTYLYSTKMIKASIALIQDAPAWFEGWLRGRMALRLWRVLNQKWTYGTGAGTIEGVIVGATLGKTTASATAITWDELMDLEHSVDPLYRVGARWMFHDNVFKYLKSLKDGDGRPLWMESLFSGAPERLDNYPYTINQDMDSTVAASNKVIAYGNFQNYMIRNVTGMVTLRLVERYAEYGQVAFLGFSRHGGLLVDAGTNPIKYMQQHG